MFSKIKARLAGTYRGVSAKHLPRYLREWSYRFNRRNRHVDLDGYLIRRAVECERSPTTSSNPASCPPAPIAFAGRYLRLHSLP